MALAMTLNRFLDKHLTLGSFGLDLNLSLGTHIPQISTHYHEQSIVIRNRIELRRLTQYLC